MDKKLSIEEMLDEIGKTLVSETNRVAKAMDETPIPMPFAILALQKLKASQVMLLGLMDTYDKLYSDVNEIYKLTEDLKGTSPYF